MTAFDQQPPESERELIMLIPGLGRSTRGHYLTMLADGIEGFLESHIEMVDFYHRVDRNDGSESLFDVRYTDGQRKIVEVTELFWNDLRPTFQTSWMFFLGFHLVRFWCSMRQWSAIPSTSRPLRRALSIGAFFLVVWYLVTLVAFLQSTGFLSWLVPSQGFVGWLWAGVTALLATGAIKTNVDDSYAAFCYLSNRQGFRQRVRRRIANALWDLGEKRPEYRRITLLAHSFGGAVAVDVLATLDARTTIFTAPLNLITVGSPLELFITREPSYDQKIKSCIGSDLIDCWTDFYSQTDSLCSMAPFHAGPKCSHVCVDLGFTRIESLIGIAHNAYLQHPSLHKALLASSSLEPVGGGSERRNA